MGISMVRVGWLVPLGCLVAALAAAVTGWGAARLERWEKPSPIALEALESGARPPSVHLEFGKHYALVGKAVAGCAETTRPTDGDGDSERPRSYYPVVSAKHALAGELERLVSRHGSVQCIPSENAPSWRGLRVFLATREQPTEASGPQAASGLRIEQKFSGYLLKASDWEDDLPTLRERFPDVDWSRVLVLQHHPPFAAIPLPFFALAGFWLLATLATALWLWRRGAALQTATTGESALPGRPA